MLMSVLLSLMNNSGLLALSASFKFFLWGGGGGGGEVVAGSEDFACVNFKGKV